MYGYCWEKCSISLTKLQYSYIDRDKNLFPPPTTFSFSLGKEGHLLFGLNCNLVLKFNQKKKTGESGLLSRKGGQVGIFL